MNHQNELIHLIESDTLMLHKRKREKHSRRAFDSFCLAVKFAIQFHKNSDAAFY